MQRTLFVQEIASMESKLKNKRAELESEKEHQKKSSSGMGDLRKQVREKENVYEKEKGKVRKAMAVSGMAEAPDTNGEQCSVREQLLRAQTRLQEMQEQRGKLQKAGFDPEAFAQLQQSYRQAEAGKRSGHETLRSSLENQLHKKRCEKDKAYAQLEKMQASASQFSNLERELKCKEHELSLLDDRINRSEHHTAEQSIQEMKAEIQKLHDDIANLPEVPAAPRELRDGGLRTCRRDGTATKNSLDIKSLDSSREDRIKYFEKHIAELKKSAKQNVDKIEKQREKTEQAQVEVEDSGRGQESIAAEIQQMSESLTAKKASYEEIGAQLENMRVELQNLDETLGKLSEEITQNKQKREEQDGMTTGRPRDDHGTTTGRRDRPPKCQAHTLGDSQEELEQKRALFGKKGTDFDFQGSRYQDNKDRLEKLSTEQKKLSKNINKKATATLEDLDEKKTETLRRTWKKVKVIEMKALNFQKNDGEQNLRREIRNMEEHMAELFHPRIVNLLTHLYEARAQALARQCNFDTSSPTVPGDDHFPGLGQSELASRHVGQQLLEGPAVLVKTEFDCGKQLVNMITMPTMASLS
eukprot:Skav202974  [mRNA]  locus=scaffold2274:471073:494478:- [translate_table: standard]